METWVFVHVCVYKWIGSDECVISKEMITHEVKDM